MFEKLKLIFYKCVVVGVLFVMHEYLRLKCNLKTHSHTVVRFFLFIKQ